jgi:hypothetical protein
MQFYILMFLYFLRGTNAVHGALLFTVGLCVGLQCVSLHQVC